jgi:L-alanine-DL-glutamate epimerase-like enolase superfamily enzyme
MRPHVDSRRDRSLRPRRRRHSDLHRQLGPALAGTYDLVRELPLAVDEDELTGLAAEVSSGFTRRTTIIHLRGGGHEGTGEDTTYAEAEQLAFQEAGTVLPVTGSHTIESFSALFEEMDSHRRWGVESAALDLALRQAGKPLSEVLGLDPRPVTFVSSLRLGDPPSIDILHRRLALYPSLRFKLDPTSDWDQQLVSELAATGAIDSVDLKGAYKGTLVDQAPDPALYRLVAEGFPEAWIEDPALTPETDPILAPYRDRITWDAPIHSVADIEALPFPPRTINIKPSRFGSIEALFDTYDYLAAEGIGAYGGGQFELGIGRRQNQYLASLFHADAPNDLAPSPYNDNELRPGLPESPLEPAPAATGFDFGA